MTTNKKSAMYLLAGVVFANTCLGQEERPKPPEAPPSRFYKLDFVVKELENDKVINSRVYTTSVSANGREPASIRSGSRIPYMTGTPTAKQFNYYEFGVNIDCREARELPSGQLTLNLNVDISSVLDMKEGGGDLPAPTVRNTKWSAPVIVPIKKTTTVFSSDDPTGNRKLQLDITAIPIT